MWWRGILAALAAFACAGFAPAPRIDYDISPVFRDGALRALEINLNFRGEMDGQTILHLPDAWGGETELWRGVEALAVVSGADLVETDDPARRTLSHQPGARIHVRYRVVQDWPGAPRAGRGNPYRPVIQPDYYHLIGNAALVMPELAGVSPVRVRARGFPRHWSFASDLEHRGLILARAHASVIVGGDFRLERSGPVRVAMRGAWSFTDAEMTTRVARIVAGHRDFWGDRASPYLVTVLPLEAPTPGWLSIGGTGLDDAFAFFATLNADVAQITRTLAHESLHTWIPNRIGGMPRENEASDYWLSEGFTDFFSARLLVREGIWGAEEYAEHFNRVLREYAQSPERTAPNVRIVEAYWSDPFVQRLPYERGQIFAALLDARLRENGHDMDDVLLEMAARAQNRDPLRAAQMLPLVTARFGLEINADLAQYVEAGQALLLPRDVFAPCGVIETREVAAFHRGFDIDATLSNGDVISGVDPRLPAYAAGMRDGMVLVRRDGGEIGNSEREIAYVVRDQFGERTLRYMPRGLGNVAMQHLQLNASHTDAACLRVLGGA